MRIGMKGILSLCATGYLLSAGQTGENIYPQGTYEVTGNSKVCRTGSKSLRHAMATPAYHVAKNAQKIKVEPFAVYRVTGYVKGHIPAGQGLALATYGWNSFGWCFMNQVRLPQDMKAWKQVSTRICVPADTVDFMPLVLSNATQAELWLDDVTIVKIQEPEDHIRELKAKAKLTDTQSQLLARYYLHNKQPQQALNLRHNASPAVKADISCLIARQSKDLTCTRKHTVEIMSLGCTQWPDGKKRVRELLNRFPLPERWIMCAEAIQKSPNLTPHVLQCLSQIDCSDLTSLPVETARQSLRIMTRCLNKMKETVARRGGAPTSLLKEPEAKLRQAQQALALRASTLGSCKLSISGQEISPENALVILPEDATITERTAADELARCLELMTGKLLQITADTHRLNGKFPIFIGRCNRQDFQVDYQKLGKDGIHCENNGDALLLAGGQRGVLYAVYSFLEEQLGFRWFTPDCSTWPKSGNISLKNFKNVYVPALKMRATDYFSYCSMLPFPVQNNYNSLCLKDSPKFGGNIHYRGFVHTMNSLIPVEQYGASHPEYYALREGVRQVARTSQPCLTNPDVLKIATAEALRWCKESPRAHIISISQNDNQNFCLCEKCTELAKREGSQMGPLLQFVNAIAREVAKKYPDKIVDTLAYQYTRKPPKHLRPEPNVAIRLCTIECCFVHPLESCPFNRSFVQDIEQWSKICRRLHIWDYVINYSHTIQPFPNLKVLKPNIQFFIDHGVTGIYEEANYFSRGAEMAELRTYLMGRLLWNPDRNVENDIREFTDAYFGPAAAPIRKYLNLLHDTVCSQTKRHVTIYAPTAAYLNDEKLLAQSFKLFADAEKAVADNPQLLRRVRNAKLPILYTRLELENGNLFLQGNKLASKGNADPKILEEFTAICQTEQVTHVGEGNGRRLKPWLDSQKNKIQHSQVVTLENQFLRMDVLPGHGGRIWRLIAKPEGHQLLRVMGDDNLGYAPETGGMEWYSTDGYHSPGWSEPYKVLIQSKNSIEMTVSLKNGRELTRRIQLSPNTPSFKVLTTIRRTGGTPKVVFRCHPEFKVADIQQCILSWKDKNTGAWQQNSLANPNAPLSEKDLWLTGKDAPDGAWGFLDRSTGLRLINRFNPSEVSLCYCNWNGADKRINLELWSKPINLPVGGTVTQELIYEVTKEN